VKRALISSLFVAAAIASSPVFAQAVASDASQVNAGPRTRAEVKAELIAAQRSGEYQAIRVDANSYPQLLPYRTHNGRTSAGATELTQAYSLGTALRAQ
jgi:Domain of unknown function (DUF4148)